MALTALPGVTGSTKLEADRANGVIEGTIAAIGPGAAFSAYGPLNLVVYGTLANALTTTAGSLSASFASATGLAVGQAINSANAPPGATIGALPGSTAVTLALAPQFWAGLVTTGSLVVRGLPASTILTYSTLVGATVVSPYFPTGATVVAVDASAQTVTLSAVATSQPRQPTVPVFLQFLPTANAITATGADSASFVSGAGVTFNADFQLERSFDGGRTWIVCNVGGTGMLAQYTSDTPVSISFGDPEACVLYRINVTAYTGVANVTIRYRISTTGQASTTLSVPAIS